MNTMREKIFYRGFLGACTFHSLLIKEIKEFKED
jgi:hypothetical protein